MSVKYVKDCITMVKELGGQEITIVPSTVGKIKFRRARRRKNGAGPSQSLKQCYEHGQKEGVRLALEPLNRFETYFLNRHDQVAAAGRRKSDRDCGICLDVFHMNIEEKDMYQAIRKSGDRLADFHVADNNRMACGMGALDWKKIIGTLKEIGYTGALTVEFVAPLDRTPANPYKNALEQGHVDLTRRRTEVHRGPRQRHALRRVLHLARGRDDQDAEEEYVEVLGRSIGLVLRSSGPASSVPGTTSYGSLHETVLLIGTLDTKGPEIAYLRDRLQALGVGTIVADSGILGEPLDIVPDVSRAEVARLGGDDDRGAAEGGQPRQGRARHAARAAAAGARPLPRRHACTASPRWAAPKARCSARAR